MALAFAMLLLIAFLASIGGVQSQFDGDAVAFQTSISSMDAFKSSYSRIAEAIRKCPVPATSSAPSFDDEQQAAPDPKWAIRNELSFSNGDWSSAREFLPLPPLGSIAAPADPVRLASLWITDVKAKNNKNIVKVSAILQLAKTMHRGISYYNAPAEDFSATPGFSVVTALLEGVYFDNSEERGLCMVGCTILPLSANLSTLPASKRTCDLFLEMHFPKTLTLRSRVVRGTLTVGGRAEKITISSQLGAYSKYEFGSKTLVDSSCTKKLQQEELELAPASVYHGSRFCSTMMQLVSGQWIDLRALSSSNTGIGPFEFRNAVVNSSSFQLRIQDIRCIDYDVDSSEDEQQKANVSAVFRVVPSNHDPTLATERTGLEDGLAFPAEGVYEASTGKLCMVGCTDQRTCNVRVTIFIPLTFSIMQRESMVGTIASLPGEFNASHFGLLASIRTLPSEIEVTYAYSKVGTAKKLAERDGAFEPGIKDKLRLALLTFPVLRKGVEQLGLDLSVHSSVIPARDGQEDRLGPNAVLAVDVIAVEDVVLRGRDSASYRTRNNEIVKVAATVELQSVLLPTTAAEGIYIPKIGKMYLVGCQRRGNSSTPAVSKSSSGDDLDCKIEVVIQVPPKNAQWLVNPTVVVQLRSTRAKDDALFFKPLHLETYPVLYDDQVKEILSRKTLEAVLSAMTLSLMILCIALQLVYVRRVKMVESVPFISLLMLAVQAFGYSLPLITGVEALFNKLAFGSWTTDSNPETTIKDGVLSVIILYVVKLLSLGAFLLVLRLCQKVVKSRIRLAIKFPLEPRKVPSEKKTLLIFLLVHVVGFSLVLLFHYILLGDSSVSPTWEGRESSPGQVFSRELKEYIGLVQDLFLLPQVIAISMWDIKGKPLRKCYYMGITLLRLLPHMYHAARRPWFNPYFAEEFSVFANPKQDFYNRAGDFFIPLLAVAMAAAVYAQQRWNALRWGKVLRSGSSRLLRYGSKLYERLPSKGLDRMGSSKNFEAELSPLDEQQP